MPAKGPFPSSLRLSREHGHEKEQCLPPRPFSRKHAAGAVQAERPFPQLRHSLSRVRERAGVRVSQMAHPDIKAGRLSAVDYPKNFCDAHPPLTPAQAQIEADRCYYCHDAPCVTACPTGIDVPSFIRRISEDNLRGAARAILEANVFGGMCARVCPTEVLCEQACVRNTQEDKPVEIGLLQRHATDHYFASVFTAERSASRQDRGRTERGASQVAPTAFAPGTAPVPASPRVGAPIFTRAAATGKHIAIVGAGPAGLACGHRAALLGHAVTVFEALPKAGGLNEYGLATYKTTDGFAQKEIDWLLSIGGIEIRHEQRLGEQLQLDALVDGYDAVFLGFGLAGVNALGLAGEFAPGVDDAVDFIAGLRQAADFASVPIGRRVVVIGGGMTAVDAAVQAKKLGAQEVTIVYRRDRDRMPASAYEQGWALRHGVSIREWSVPRALDLEGGQVRGVSFAEVREVGGQFEATGRHWAVEADTVLKAIGQTLSFADASAARLEIKRGRLRVDEEGRTSLQKVWAGGDCTWGGQDLTVEAVEHGKIAAHSIDRSLGILRSGKPFTRVRKVAA